jgi:hypothetical protein
MFVAIFMLVVAVVTLCSAVGTPFFDWLLKFFQFNTDGSDPDRFLMSYVCWSVSMGIIGAAASIGMNAIHVLHDGIFDISSKPQNWMRLVLGGVFGLVLALPFGLGDYTLFCYYAGHLGGDVTPPFPDPLTDAVSPLAYAASMTSSVTYAFALLAPFLFGYSTSLVTIVLSQLINGLQAYVAKGSSGRSEDRSPKNTPSG